MDLVGSSSVLCGFRLECPCFSERAHLAAAGANLDGGMDPLPLPQHTLLLNLGYRRIVARRGRTAGFVAMDGDEDLRVLVHADCWRGRVHCLGAA